MGGTEYVHRALAGATAINRSLNGEIGTCDLWLISPDNPWSQEFAQQFGPEELRLLNQQEVYLTRADGERMFGGRISRVGRELFAADRICYKVACSDFNSLLDRSILPRTFTPSPDKYVIQTLFSDNPTGIDTANVEYIANLPEMTFNGTLGAALQEIAKYTTGLFFVDYYKRLHYFPSGSRTSPFDLDEEADSLLGVDRQLWGADALFGNGTLFGGNVLDNVRAVQWLRAGMAYTIESTNPANRVTVRGLWQEDTTTTTAVDPDATATDRDGMAGQQKSPTWPPIASFPFEGGFYDRDATVATAEQTRYVDGGFTYYRASTILLEFDTSGIPADAVIDAASLRLTVTGFQNPDSLYGNPAIIGVEYVTPAAIFASSYSHIASNSAYGFEFPPFTSSSVAQLPLRNADALINRTGTTGFRIHLVLQNCQAGDPLTWPQETNVFSVLMQEGAAQGLGDAPQLSLVYHVVNVGTRIQETVEDAVSIAELASGTDDGVRFRFISNPKILSAETARQRAQYELDQFNPRFPKTSGALGCLREGLDIGQVVRINSPSLHFDETHMINRVSINWFGGTTYLVLTGIEFGHYRPGFEQTLKKMELALRDQGALN